MPAASASERRAAWTVLGVSLALGALLRGYLALTDAGIYWPDEIYQSLEPAHRLVFGFGLLPWEYVQGARTWALPGMIAGVWELLRAVGLGRSAVAVPVLKLLFSGVGLLTAWATFRLARAVGTRPGAAALGAAAFALCAPALYFGPRAMSETACALPATWGLALLLDRNAGRRAAWIASGLLTVAVLLRLQCGLLCVAALAVLAARRAWRPLLECAGGLLLGALLFGLLDRLTWGSWFHSAVEYLRYNVVEGKASGFGTSDALYYLTYLYRSMPLLALATAALALLGTPRARGLAFIAATFLVAHSLIPHKELRFVFPLLPLAFALAAAGLQALDGPALRGAAAVWGVSALISAAGFHQLTFRDLGAYLDAGPDRSAYDDNGSVNRLLAAAGRRPDVCGVGVGVHAAWMGGYTYLDRNVPLYAGALPPPSPRAFNYVIARVPANAPAVARDGDWALLKRFDGPCVPDPGYSSHLP